MRRTLALIFLASIIALNVAFSGCSSSAGQPATATPVRNAQKVLLTPTASGQKTPVTQSQPTAQSTTQANAAKPELFTLKVQTPEAFSPFFIAEEKGFLAEENLKLEYTGVLKSPEIIPSVISGANHIGAGHANNVISAIAAGVPIKAVLGETSTVKDIPHTQYYVQANSPIKSAKDLAGKKIAIGSFGTCAEYIIREYLRQQEAGLDKKVELVAIPDLQQQEPLDNGIVNLAAVHTTTAARFKADPKKYQLIFTDYDVQPNGKLGMALQFFKTDFIKDHPDIVKRYVRAMSKTLDWIDANRQDAIAIAAKRLKVEPSMVATMNYAEHGLVTAEEVKVWFGLLEKEGQLPKAPNLDDIYTNEFNPFAK